MSGIAGYVWLDGRPAEPESLRAMAASLAHRGPDGAGTWHEGPAGLAHCLLCTTPESLTERQPLAGAGGRHVIAADARLDNRDELAGALGIDARGLPDCELILAAYEKWGVDCASRLLGDFAFAIWDAGKRQLYLARDSFGVKPLFYYQSPRLLAFATEIKALFCLDDVPRRINEARVADYLAPALHDSALTFYEDIWRMPAAHYALAGAAGTRFERFWQLDPERTIRRASDEEYGSEFREILAAAVGARLRSAYPVGSMLSGGMDSSSVSCMARHLLAGGERRLKTFAVTFAETPGSDERDYMQSVLDGGGLEHHYVPGERISPLEDVDAILWHRDEPWNGLGLCVQWATYRGAHAQGARVLLSGNGGDTVIGHGATRLTEMAARGQWLGLAAELNSIAGLQPGRLRRLWEMWRYYGLRPFVPEPLMRARRSLRRLTAPAGRHAPTWAGRTFINPAFAWEVERAGPPGRWHARPQPAPRSEREAHYRDIINLANNHDAHDRSAAAWGLEQRHPLLDRRLAEFCVALPPEQKLRDGHTRIVLRNATIGILPEKIRTRAVKGAPMHGLARALMLEHRPLLDEVVLGDDPVLARCVNVPLLRQRYASLCEHEVPPPPLWATAAMICRVVVLATWLRQTQAPAPAPHATTVRIDAPAIAIAPQQGA